MRDTSRTVSAGSTSDRCTMSAAVSSSLSRAARATRRRSLTVSGFSRTRRSSGGAASAAEQVGRYLHVADGIRAGKQVSSRQHGINPLRP